MSFDEVWEIDNKYYQNLVEKGNYIIPIYFSRNNEHHILKLKQIADASRIEAQQYNDYMNEFKIFCLQVRDLYRCEKKLYLVLDILLEFMMAHRDLIGKYQAGEDNIKAHIDVYKAFLSLKDEERENIILNNEVCKVVFQHTRTNFLDVFKYVLDPNNHETIDIIKEHGYYYCRILYRRSIPLRLSDEVTYFKNISNKPEDYFSMNLAITLCKIKNIDYINRGPETYIPYSEKANNYKYFFSNFVWSIQYFDRMLLITKEDEILNSMITENLMSVEEVIDYILKNFSVKFN